MPHLAPETLSYHNRTCCHTPDWVYYAFGTTFEGRAYHHSSLAWKLHFEHFFTHHESECVKHTQQYKEVGGKYCVLSLIAVPAALASHNCGRRRLRLAILLVWLFRWQIWLYSSCLWLTTGIMDGPKIRGGTGSKSSRMSQYTNPEQMSQIRRT